MKLTTANVTELLKACLVTPEELKDSSISQVHVQSVMGVFGLHQERLEAKREEVRDLLSQFNKYPQSQPFQNLCMDKDFHQWGEHRNINELLALGMGLNLVELDHTKKFAGIPSVRFSEAPVRVEDKTYAATKPPLAVQVPLAQQEAIKHTAVLLIGDNAYLQLPAGQIIATIAAVKQARAVIQRLVNGEQIEALLAELEQAEEDARKDYVPYEQTGVREAFEGR
jgi:hypothetical protein